MLFLLCIQYLLLDIRYLMDILFYLQDADSHLYICEVGNYLIVQLKRFLVIDDVVSKYAAPVICTPYLDVPVRVDDEVSCVKKFALVSGICHSGSLHSGHYTAFARDGVW